MAVDHRGGFFRPGTSLLVALAVALAVALTGCSDADVPPRRDPGAVQPSDAVTRLVRDLRHDDLDGYARHAVPPALHARLDVAWREGRSRWPLTGLPMHARLPGLLTTLAAPDAEKALLSDYERQFAGADRELRAAAATLGLFAIQTLQREGQGNSNAGQHSHDIQLTRALMHWGERAPLGERKRAKAAIGQLVSAARLTGLAGKPLEAAGLAVTHGGAGRVGDGRAGKRATGSSVDNHGPVGMERAGGGGFSADRFAQLGMQRSLRRLGPFFARVKHVLLGYGLDLDAALDSVRVDLVDQTGDAAGLRLRYVVAGRAIDTALRVERIDGQWYLSDALRRARAQAAAPGVVDETVASRPRR